MKRLLVLLLIASVQGQSLTDMGTDNAEDVLIGASGVPYSNAPSGTFTDIDILGLTVEEFPGEFIFHVALADMNTQASSLNANIDVYFTHEDMDYRIRLERFASFFGNFYEAYVQVWNEGSEYWSYVDWVEAEIDVATSVVSVPVERYSIPDSDGASPFPGRSLTDVYVLAQAGTRTFEFEIGPVGSPPQPEAVDRFPDTGVSTEVIEVSMGAKSSGPVGLFSFDPFRASNGEETTYIFEVFAANYGDNQEFTLEALQVPADWDVILPITELPMPTNATYRLPVFVSMPFSHDHGKIESFLLRLEGENGDFAEMEMGVRFLEIPQPAGHHDTVYFHTERSFGIDEPTGSLEGHSPFMNTVEDFDGSTKAEVNAFRTSNTEYGWYIPLQPELRLGLDFILDEVGEIFIPIRSDVPLIGAEISGELYYYGEDEYGFGVGALVATFNSTGPQDIQGEASFNLEVIPTEDGDYLPYLQDSYLGLWIGLDNQRPHVYLGEPVLRPGGWMRLPLEEYHDNLEGFEGLLSGVHLIANTTDRMVNPGETTIFHLQLHNAADTARSFDLSIESESNWAQMLSGEKVLLKADQMKSISVAVNAPSDAQDGDMAIVTLQAVDSADPAGIGVIQLRAYVTTEQNLVDEKADARAIQDKEKQSPGLPLVVVLVALALLARRR